MGSLYHDKAERQRFYDNESEEVCNSSTGILDWKILDNIKIMYWNANSSWLNFTMEARSK